jgi:hypothetical protein
MPEENLMALTANTVEQIAQWCVASDSLGDIRARARSDFFGYDEPGTINYMADTGEINGRERRFLGWFSFNFRLPDGRHPAELAATALIHDTGLFAITKAIQEAIYITAIVTIAIPNKGAFLELEAEEFEVNNRILGQTLFKDDVLCAHVIPVGRNRWVAGPGWLVWPTRFGPGIRSSLKKFQLDPIQAERFLQQRGSDTGKDKPKIDYPQDNTLEAAVARMTDAAKTNGKNSLVRSVEDWQGIVLKHMATNDLTRFSKDILKQVGITSSLDELNKWINLATNIWNNVP